MRKYQRRWDGGREKNEPERREGAVKEIKRQKRKSKERMDGWME
jgi:hypothetical protein